MHKFAEMIVRALEKRTIIPAADHDVYVYGLKAARRAPQFSKR